MSFLWYFPSNTFVAIPIIKKMSSDSVVKPCYRNEFHDTRGGIEDRCGFWSCLLKLVFFFSFCSTSLSGKVMAIMMMVVSKVDFYLEF